jgi:hypothetical protein
MNPLNLILGILGVALSLVAFFAVVGALFANRVSRTQSIIEAMPGRSFTVGLVNLVFFGTVTLVFFSLSERLHGGGMRLLGVIFLAALSIGVAFGLTAMAEVLGARIRDQAVGLARTAWGTILLALACALPFIGWFVLLPYAASLGLGGFILSLFSRPTEA